MPDKFGCMEPLVLKEDSQGFFLSHLVST